MSSSLRMRMAEMSILSQQIRWMQEFYKRLWSDPINLRICHPKKVCSRHRNLKVYSRNHSGQENNNLIFALIARSKILYPLSTKKTSRTGSMSNIDNISKYSMTEMPINLANKLRITTQMKVILRMRFSQFSVKFNS